MDHKERVEKAKRAIETVFSDVSVTKTEMRESLRDIISHAEVMIEALGEDD